MPKKKKSDIEGSGFYIDEDTPYRDTTMEHGSGAYFEDHPSSQTNSSGKPSGFYDEGTNKKKKEDKYLKG